MTLQSDATYSSPFIKTASASEAPWQSKAKSENVLGQMDLNSLKQESSSLTNANPTEKLYRNHSVQLVKLQSKLHEIQRQRAQDMENVTTLMSAVKDIYGKIAEVKGKLAHFTIEAHTVKDTSPSSHQTVPTPQPTLHAETPIVHGTPMPTNESSDFWLIVRKADGNIESLALPDKLLLEQRSHIIEAMKSIIDIDKRLTEVLGAQTVSADPIAVEPTIESTPIKQEPVETPVKFNFGTEEIPQALRERFLFRLESIK